MTEVLGEREALFARWLLRGGRLIGGDFGEGGARGRRGVPSGVECLVYLGAKLSTARNRPGRWRRWIRRRETPPLELDLEVDELGLDGLELGVGGNGGLRNVGIGELEDHAYRGVTMAPGRMTILSTRPWVRGGGPSGYPRGVEPCRGPRTWRSIGPRLHGLDPDEVALDGGRGGF